jgi:myo-inositol-1(or 4)-monophosphatase
MEEILITAAKAGSEILKKYFKTELEHIIKSVPGDFLTKADLESQEIIVKTLRGLMVAKGYREEEIGFIAEESLDKPTKHTFIIDPLDGTASFAEGEDRFAISIAYTEKQETIEAIIYHPITNTIYYAKKNQGSFLISNGERKRLIIPYTPLSKSIVTMHFSSNPDVAKKVLKVSINLIPHLTRLREKASACLSICEIAINKYQSNFNGKSFIWDLAAAKLIIEEAEGIMTDWSGEKIKFDFEDFNKSYSTIVGNEKLVSEMLPYFRYE